MTTKIELVRYWSVYKPGDTVEVGPGLASTLIRDGVARAVVESKPIQRRHKMIESPRVNVAPIGG